MGYVFLCLALLAGVTKGYCGKKTSGTVTAFSDTVLFNAVRMCLCILIGFFFAAGYAGSPAALLTDRMTLLISAVSGIATSVFVVAWIAAVRTGAYMMVDVFLTLGVIVPILFCRVFFAEEVRLNQIIGIALLAVSAWIMCGYSNTVKRSRITVGSLALLCLCGISNGLTSFTQKWFRYASSADASVFNFYTYLFSAAVLLICWCTVRKKTPRNTAADPARKKTLARLAAYVVIMSLCLFLHSYFSTRAGAYLTASQLYPLMQGGSLVLSMLMSAACFGEKITPRCVCGIAVCFAALLCINLL